MAGASLGLASKRRPGTAGAIAARLSAMLRNIHLSGGEVSILKAIGLSAQPIHGRQLLERVGEMEPTEVVDDLNGLVMLGYVVSDKTSIRNVDEVEQTVFHVNANYVRDLREAITPVRHEPERRRRRRG